MNREPLYGLVAGFKTPQELITAAEHARNAGFKALDGYSPFPIEGLEEALGGRPTRLPLLVLVGGLVGGLGGFFMQYYAAVIGYPLNIGGRPLNSWPSFIPITFELTILVAGLTAAIGMLLLNGFPRPYHPLFNVPAFERATVDRFYLCIEASDPLFDTSQTRRFLEQLQPTGVYDVER